MMKQLLYLLLLVKLGIAREGGSEECPYGAPGGQGDQDPHPLVNLGNSLKFRLTDLSAPCPHGILIYKDIQRYYNLLSDVYRLLKDRDAVDIVKGFKVYDEISKAGGPPHLGITMDYVRLTQKYNWQGSGDVKAIKEVMLLTKELWEDIEDRVTHLRSGQPEPTPVEQSTIDWTPFIREVSSGSEASHY